MVHWHEISSGQSFILNVKLVKGICRALNSKEQSWTTFVRLTDPPTVAHINLHYSQD